MKKYEVIFWDFDGVIKDSVSVKSVAFEQIFLPFGHAIAKRVRQHHETHSGVSRQDKIPLYLQWAGELCTPEKINEYCENFSNIVLQAVINSPWVPGVREYLKSHHEQQYFVLVTATPHEEIEYILDTLEISHYFREVHGAPTLKSTAISKVLENLSCQPEVALMVGDSETDLLAAEENNIAFMLRSTPLNKKLQHQLQGAMFENLAV